MNEPYSVLMSVYHKEQPEYFRAALSSIKNQSMPADEVVLVCDGLLTKELDQVIEEFMDGSSWMNVIRLPQNRGLGYALSEGLRYCKNDLIARMDTDDIAVNTRCERQIMYMKEHPEVDVLSGTLAEFTGAALAEEEARKNVLAYKKLPISHSELSAYIKYRNPMNHPCVMFRKEKAQKAGGYRSCYLFEDYDLWVRMYLHGCVFANLSHTLLYMRINHMHTRRGGFRYAKAIVAFETKLYRQKVITFPQYVFLTFARVAVSILPNGLRKRIYDGKLRKH